MKSAFSYALILLKFSRRTKKELERKLLSKGYTRKEVEEAICKLQELGLLDELEQAIHTVELKCAKGWSIAKIKEYLFRKGYPKDVVEEALGYYDRDKAKAYLISRLAKKNYDKEKAIRFILSRGFSLGFAMEVVNELSQGTPEDTEFET